MRKTTKRLLLACGSTVVVFGVAELLYRAVRREPQNTMHFRDAARRLRATRPVDWEFQQEIQVPWPRAGLPAAISAPAPGEQQEWFGTGYPMPRDNPTGNATWRPGAAFFICWGGPPQPYFDADGCVEYRFNRFGLRDRADLELGKPPGTRRVVCLGDSFTLGWGVRQDHNWPVLVERELRKQWPAVQVINCGGAGSAYADEYELALRWRHGRFQPDLVLVTLCLNDLLITNGKLCHYRTAALPDGEQPDGGRPWWQPALLHDIGRALAARHALDLDPQRDWTRELLELPAGDPCYRSKGESPDLYWAAGTPQRALRGIRDWCRDHGARAAVVVWPLLQGLGEDRHYPFAGMHERVAGFCRDEGLPCLDLLPVLRGESHETLWVSPDDMHPNELAQQLVAPSLAAFCADVLELH